MKIDRDAFKRRIRIFGSSIIVFVVFLFFTLITSAIKGVYGNNVRNANEQIALLDNEIVAANKIVITDTILTNIDNVKYDVVRCNNDDKEVFKLLKPLLSYENADDYNTALADFKGKVSSAGADRVFKKIDYKDLDYMSESDYGGQSYTRYSSLPSSFRSFVTGIDGDRYDYIATVRVDITEPTKGRNNVTSSKVIVLTYSTDSKGIDYDSFDAMICK